MLLLKEGATPLHIRLPILHGIHISSEVGIQSDCIMQHLWIQSDCIIQSASKYLRLVQSCSSFGTTKKQEGGD